MKKRICSHFFDNRFYHASVFRLKESNQLLFLFLIQLIDLSKQIFNDSFYIRFLKLAQTEPNQFLSLLVHFVFLFLILMDFYLKSIVEIDNLINVFVLSFNLIIMFILNFYGVS